MKKTKGIEDYLEAIYVLSREKDGVKVSNIAKFLAVKLPSVTEAVDKLTKEGLVEHTNYGSVHLTEKGLAIGRETWDKHQILFTFLKDVLGVSEVSAFKEACLMEHAISSETRNKIKEYLKKIKS